MNNQLEVNETVVEITATEDNEVLLVNFAVTGWTETDPVFSTSEASNFVSGDKAKLDSALQEETDPIYNQDKPTIALKSELPANVSELNNDTGYITLEEVPVQVETDPVYNNDKPDIALKSEIPVNTSELNNDSGFITSADIPSETDPVYESEKDNFALKTNVLEKDNVTAFTPTTDYHPATKKYVDDNIGSGGTSNHAELSNLDFENSGHTGFETTANKVTDFSGISGVDDGKYPTAKAVDDRVKNQSITEHPDVTISGYAYNDVLRIYQPLPEDPVLIIPTDTPDMVDYAFRNGAINPIESSPLYTTSLTSALLNLETEINSKQDSGSYLTSETDPVFTAWDKDHDDLTNKGTNSHASIDTHITNYNTLLGDSKDPTGWLNPDQVNVSYDVLNRTITLTGDLTYYWQGDKRALTSPYTSIAHDSADGTYFLYSTDGTNFAWSTTPWEFYHVMVALAKKSTTPAYQFAIKETHGLMPWQVHLELHKQISSYRDSGGNLIVGTYAENTASDSANSPSFDQAIVRDEDDIITIPQWDEGTYTTLRIGASSKATFDTTATLPFRSSGSYVLVNDPLTGNETATVTSRYVNVYQVLIPATSDVDSQKYRMVMLQPQRAYTSLATAQAEDPRGLNFGDLANSIPEFVIYARITYVTSAGDSNTGKCRIATNGVTYVYGSRLSQISVGGFTPSNHNDLTGLQGGTTDEYNHLTNAQLIVVTNTSGTNTGDEATASTTVEGVVELATTAETTTGTDTARAVTPDGLAGSDFGKRIMMINVFDNATAITTGDGKWVTVIPQELNGMNLVSAHAYVDTVSSSGTPTIQIRNVTDAQDMLSTRITIDANENSSYTATTAPVINATYDDVATGDRIAVDVDVTGTGTKGLQVVLTFQLP